MKMRLTWAWVLAVLMFVSLEGWWSEGCLEKERFALLQLKQHVFNHTYYLEDWVKGDENSDCCLWEGVVCSNTTGRVLQLFLGGKTNPILVRELFLNVSLFSPFEELEWLDLYDNRIAGCVENEGFERLTHLSNFEYLNLEFNVFRSQSSILSSLSKLSSLKSLYLTYNQFKEVNNFKGSDQWLSRLTNLKVLDLSGNIFGNSILSSLSGLSLLKELYLPETGLQGTVDLQVLPLNHLEVLEMSDNDINRILFPKDKNVLKNLTELHLRNLSADGSTLLLSSGLLPSIQILNLRYNNFSEIRQENFSQESNNFTEKSLLTFLALDNSKLHISLLQSIIGSGVFTSLETLLIEDSHIDYGILPIRDFPKLKNMKYLNMEFTNVDKNFLQVISKSFTSLESLLLSNSSLKGTLFDTGLCDLVHLQFLEINNNDLAGSLPSCLANLTSLEDLDISSNHFTGSISSSPLRFLTAIKYLKISNNHFQISLNPFFNHSKLKVFYGANNEIYVEESDSLAPKFQLNSIILSSYGDGASFPKFLYHQYDLQEVDLSHIFLKGQFPNWLLDNNTQLRTLYLVNNSLSGIFQLPNHPHMNLNDLDISINSFCGHIPVEIGAYLPMLSNLNISRNILGGSIPSSFGNMKFLESLDLSRNFLSGKIPEDLAMGCFSLELLALSHNNLTGQIFSKKFNLTGLLWLELEGNQFTGAIPDSMSKCSLFGLYLEDNHLSGRIPRWLENMTDLADFIVPNNHLEGPIPLELCHLENLEVIDLSSNNINGSLPSCLFSSSLKKLHLSRNRLQGQLEGAFFNSSFLMILDVGHNHLHGRIPYWISRFSNLTYLILRNNNFEGELPVQLCQLDQLRLIDLSRNNLSGHIPPCLNISTIFASTSLPLGVSGGSNNFVFRTRPTIEEESIEFTTKNIFYFYQGRILTYMSGIDLSCNELTGEIPSQIGNLVGIHTLNLSHNNLTGPIPPTFQNLKNIESLDLSYNTLNGTIPPQLVELTTLAVFSVAHNNLTGKIPYGTAQFGTFEAGSYEGNPFLCGKPLNKSCNANDSTSLMPKASFDNGEDNNFIDMTTFYISFTVSYLIMLLVIFLILYINPYWRRTCFYLIEKWMTSCCYFVVDHLPK